MSRVGKNPVPIPSGVTVDLEGQDLRVKGKRGELSLVVHDDVAVARDGDALVFQPRGESRRARTQWGTARNLAHNMVRGVSDGFTINLEINGVGYRAQADAKTLKLQLGFSHDVEVPIPAGISIRAIKPTEVEITGADRQRVGQIAAEIRSLRPPEPYKGKGIKYSTEKIRRKEGKKK
jgi:large subunit ribosomal protein L6